MFFLFSSLVCLILCCHFKEKFCLDQSWELKVLSIGSVCTKSHIMLSLSFFLDLFQQLFFKFDENLKMVLNQFISVSQGVKNEIDKWIFGFEYATILLKKKEPFLHLIVGFYAHFLYFVWKSIFLNVYRDFSERGNGT